MPGMTARDHFAAAALTGLLANEGDGPVLSHQCEYAYRIADAMLRERAKTNHDAAPEAIAGTPGTGDTDHGASPEAIARTDADRGRTDKADFRPGKGTGDTQEPVAWSVANGKGLLATSISRIDAVDMQSEYEVETAIVPLYRSPTLTDAEREAVEWAATHLDNCGWGSATLRGLLERLG